MNKYELLQAIQAAPNYQYIPPELFQDKQIQDYLVRRNQATVRRNIERNDMLDLDGKSVLDLGCEVGFFGWYNKLTRYTGIDLDGRCIDAAKAIALSIDASNVHFINIDLMDFLKIEDKKYDIVLFFSVYHHLLEQMERVEAQRVLQQISEIGDVMYFDMGQKDEVRNASRAGWHDLLPNIPPKMFIENEIILNSEFTKCEIIGETNVKYSPRLLFRFAR